jgi:BirA family biotin operon repressor/biotin-[acetyl-CoA-carboxylase] ligase
VSPPGAGLYLSLAYTFARTPPGLPGLTLALGVGVIGALDGLGRADLWLKWPNDIVVRDGKLGGILTEARSRQGDGVSVVAGLGLNIDLPADLAPPPGRSRVLPAVDMASVFETIPSRERLAGSLVEALVESMVRFEASGFDAFAAAWRRHDWLNGRRVVVELAGKEISGIASGVEADGALVLDGPDGRTRIISGSISKVSGRGVPA